jgi:mono/diheme cytochrome c family protein
MGRGSRRDGCPTRNPEDHQVQKSAKIRVLGLALTCAAAASASMLLTVAGNGAELPSLSSPAHDLPAMAEGRILLAASPAFQVGVAPPSEAPADAAPADAAAAADAAPAGHPVSYATEQATRGQKRFESDCVDCHGDDLRGGLNGGPPLRGVSFEEKYAQGAPASALFEFMSTLMPPNDPGRFSPSVYADLMAYVLKVNGFKPGAPLPSDVDALDNLTMDK